MGRFGETSPVGQFLPKSSVHMPNKRVTYCFSRFLQCSAWFCRRSAVANITEADAAGYSKYLVKCPLQITSE